MMNKNLCLNNSEKEWLLSLRSVLKKKKLNEYTPLPPEPGQPNNEIWYTSYNGEIIVPDSPQMMGNMVVVGDFGGANIISNTYENGKGIMKFDREVTKIGTFVFGSRGYFTSISLPNSVTELERGSFNLPTTFENETSGWMLPSITIPDSVTTIDNAFSGIINVEYHGTAEGSPWGAGFVNSYREGNLFYTDSTKTTLVTAIVDDDGSVVIPEGVTSIYEMGGFYSYKILTSITLPSTLESNLEWCFADCTRLTSITFSGSVITSIGENAFYNCTRLTSITIPSSVESIGQTAFQTCTSLTSITIPESVRSIGMYAFWGCTGLTSITSLNTTPPTLGSSVFDLTADIPIYVPSESVDTYKSANGWSTYADHIQAIQ